MSQDITCSRGALYAKYKTTDPDVAQKLLGDQYSAAQRLHSVGAAALMVSCMGMAVFFGFGSIAYLPGALPSFVTGGGLALGAIGAIGLIPFCIGVCRKKDIRLERLTALEVRQITGKNLIDPIQDKDL